MTAKTGGIILGNLFTVAAGWIVPDCIINRRFFLALPDREK
jgi:hypothetical protein